MQIHLSALSGNRYNSGKLFKHRVYKVSIRSLIDINTFKSIFITKTFSKCLLSTYSMLSGHTEAPKMPSQKCCYSILPLLGQPWYEWIPSWRPRRRGELRSAEQMLHSQKQCLLPPVQSQFHGLVAMESDRHTSLKDKRKTPFSSREAISAWQLKRYLYSKQCKIASYSFQAWSVTIKLFCSTERQFYSPF